MASEQEIIQLYNPPRECPNDRCHSLFPEFIYCVIIPTAVVLLVMLLAIITMCNSKCCKCRKYSSLQTQTNDIQMENYNSIRRASANLRLMSQNRETPMMGSRASSMTLDRSQRRTYRPRDSSSSAPGTLQSQRHLRSRLLDQSASGPPPPYSAELEESFTGQQKRVLPEIAQRPPLPPPAYSKHSDDVFLGQEFLEPSMQVSVRYDDSPDHNGNGVQPLLFPRSYNA